MGSTLKASDYYNLSSLIPVAGFADYVHGRQAVNVDWYKDEFAVSCTVILKDCSLTIKAATLIFISGRGLIFHLLRKGNQVLFIIW